jgi:hypothetical protein
MMLSSGRSARSCGDNEGAGIQKPPAVGFAPPQRRQVHDEHRVSVGRAHGLFAVEERVVVADRDVDRRDCSRKRASRVTTP